ncbi:MAG: phosphonate ABC transporter, permease protein PhnE [Trueperaceae bacterium]
MGQPDAAPAIAGRLRTIGTAAIFLALLWVAGRQTDFSFVDLWTGANDFFGFFLRLNPDWRALSQIWAPLLETLQIAYLGTVFGTLLAAPLIFLASFNTTANAPVMWIARTILTLIRSIPDLLYAAILAPILSIGPLPGVVALTIFTMAVLAKLASETVEAVDPGPLEALRATGAGRNRMIVYSVLPQIGATMTSYILYVFEINVRASTVLGLVGAGGLGQLLVTYLNFFDYEGIAVLIIVIFAVVLLIDAASVYIRTRLL